MTLCLINGNLLTEKKVQRVLLIAHFLLQIEIEELVINLFAQLVLNLVWLLSPCVGRIGKSAW